MDTITQKVMIRFESTLKLFLVRDFGFSFEEAEKELSLIRAAGAYSLLTNPFDYVRMSRKGSRKTISRASRLSIAVAIGAAYNHATFVPETEMRKLPLRSAVATGE